MRKRQRPRLPNVQRQLSAIMFADIVGYTALMQRDESAAVACCERFRTVLDDEVALAGGEVVQYYGDDSPLQEG